MSQELNPAAATRLSRVIRSCLIVAFLLALTGSVFAPLRTHEFVNYDDTDYVTKNPVVTAGLTARGVRWAFTSVGYAGNWHPLTWLSHMLDVSLFGMNPGWHHLASLCYHTATTVLLFLALQRLGGAAWPSAFTAALFAIHPLHVESVAWLSDRKGLLCALFWVLTIAAYGAYARRRTPPRYAAVVLCHALSLLAKPFSVTLPLVLLLLDYWPLGRLRLDGADASRPAVSNTPFRLLAEKVPLLALSVASGLVTMQAQRKAGAFSHLDVLVRVDNAVISYVRYLAKTLWPAKLAIVYPHPGQRLPVAAVAGACLILLGISVLALRWRRRHPQIAVGWLWFVITLVPAIGLLHVGAAAMADRYSYLPLIGLFVGIGWTLPRVATRWSWGKPLLAVGVALLLCLSALLARRQVHHWSDSVSLFRHAIEVTENNYTAHFNLGMALVERRDYGQALLHITKTLEIDPSHEEARMNQGILLYIRQFQPGGKAFEAAPSKPFQRSDLR